MNNVFKTSDTEFVTIFLYFFLYRPQLEDHNTDEDRQDGMIPPRFIDVQHGKIYLGPPKQLDTVKDKVGFLFVLLTTTLS